MKPGGAGTGGQDQADGGPVEGPGALPVGRPEARRGPASGLNTAEVREWAKAQGIEMKDRSR
jgi:hypothetical protein